jgi:hypothetical protein
MFPRRYM